MSLPDSLPEAPRAAAAPRLVFLDTLRILAFGLLVVFHVGMLYGSWTFHLKSPAAGRALDPWMLASSPWRMSLIFFVSGAATALMLRRGRGDGAWLKQRMKRLLLPLLFGVFVVVAPQAWVEVMHKHGYAGGFVEFMGLYLRAWNGFCSAPGQCLILPTWNHLWFLPYLATYTAALWLALRWRPDALDAAASRCELALRGSRLLWLPLLLVVAVRLLLRPRFAITYTLVDDILAHALYLPMFLLGAAAARAASWARFEALRWAALGVAVVAWLVLVIATTTPGSIPRAWGWAAASAMQWSAVVAAVGFAHRWLNRDFAWRATLTEAVFPVYVLHQTFVILFAWWALPYRIDARLEAPAIVVATFVACGAVYLVVRRVAWLRPWFGLGARAGIERHAAFALSFNRLVCRDDDVRVDRTGPDGT